MVDQVVRTKAIKRAAQRVLELSKGTGGGLLIVGASGIGKSTFLRHMVGRLRYPDPAGYYAERIRRMDGFDGTAADGTDGVDRETVLTLASTHGLVDEENRPEVERVLGWEFQGDYEQRISPQRARTVLHDLALRFARPPVPPLDLAQLYGITPTPFGRCPFLLTGRVADTPDALAARVLAALGSSRRLKSRFSMEAHLQILHALPSIIFFDEADTLTVKVLRWIQQLCTESDTPLVLAGTDQIVQRLRQDSQLDPLHTRLERVFNLGEFDREDLETIAPDIPPALLPAVFRASRRRIRVALQITQLLRTRMQAAPTKALRLADVRYAARQVLAADPARVDAPEPPEAAPAGPPGLPATTDAPPRAA